MPSSAVAEAEGNRCVVCGKGYNQYDPLTNPPTCSNKDCWFFWITIWDHKGNPCWITGCLEVYCGINTPGYCCQCDVFQTEQEIKRRGMNKEELSGNY